MTYENVQSNTSPASVTIEALPDGRQRVILTRNVSEEQEEGQKLFRYDEAVFYVPDDRQATTEEIERDKEAWWEYAAEEHAQPTLDERLTVLEDAIAALMEV